MAHKVISLRNIGRSQATSDMSHSCLSMMPGRGQNQRDGFHWLFGAEKEAGLLTKGHHQRILSELAVPCVFLLRADTLVYTLAKFTEMHTQKAKWAHRAHTRVRA